MSNRRRLRRQMADGITPNPYRGTVPPGLTGPTGPAAAPVWRESSRPLQVGQRAPARSRLPGRRGQR